MDVKQCKDCKRPIAFVKRAGEDDRWVCLDAAPVDLALAHTATCWALSGVWAHKPRELEELLRVRRQITEEEAREMSRQDFPWHTTHHCKENTE